MVVVSTGVATDYSMKNVYSVDRANLIVHHQSHHHILWWWFMVIYIEKLFWVVFNQMSFSLFNEVGLVHLPDRPPSKPSNYVTVVKMMVDSSVV